MKTILLVDNDERALTALSEWFARRPGEWQTRGARSGSEALDQLAQARADVILTALVLPGMDGVQLLQEVTRRHPRLIRITMAGISDREQTLQKASLAHQHLAKPCDLEALDATLAHALALRDLLTNEPLQKLVAQLRSLPSLPALYLQLMNELRSEDPALDHIGEIVSRDMAMSAKLLQVINSAAFGLGHQVADPVEAAIYLGVETVKGLVLSLQIFSHFDRSHLRASEFSQEALWRHCWNTGIRARHIAHAEGLDPATVDHCFVGGLLHDVGKLILASELPDQYQRVLNRVRQKQIHLVQAEREILGCTHAELGAYLLGQWHMPDAMVEAVALHHRPGDSIKAQLSPLTVVHAANALDRKLHTAVFSAEDARLDLDYLIAAGVADRLEDWWVLCLEAGTKKN